MTKLVGPERIINSSQAGVDLVNLLRDGVRLRGAGSLRWSAAMVVVLRRAELRPVESYQRAHLSNIRGAVQGASGPDRNSGHRASWRGRGEPGLLGTVRKHHGRDASTEHDRSPCYVGRIRNENVAKVGEGQPRWNAKGCDSVEFPADKETLHHHVLRSKDSRDPIMGR